MSPTVFYYLSFHSNAKSSNRQPEQRIRAVAPGWRRHHYRMRASAAASVGSCCCCSSSSTWSSSWPSCRSRSSSHPYRHRCRSRCCSPSSGPSDDHHVPLDVRRVAVAIVASFCSTCGGPTEVKLIYGNQILYSFSRMINFFLVEF